MPLPALPKSPTQQILDLPVDLQELLDNLDFTEATCADAARNQPRLFATAGRYYSQKYRARMRAEHHAELMESETNLQIRWHDKEQGEKRTEAYIKALVGKSKRVNDARKRLMTSQVEEQWSKHLYDAYRQRGNSIRVVSDLLGDEVAMESRMSTAQTREMDSLKKQLLNKRRFDHKSQPEVDDD